VGPTGQPHPKADRWGTRSGRVKEKEKGPARLWAKKVLGRLKAQPSSAWLHGSARPATQQAGLVLGLTRHVGWLSLTGQPTATTLPLSLSLSLFDKTGPGAVPHASPTAGPACRSPTGSGVTSRSGAARPRVVPCACVPVCVWRASCVC
jgi:hypothetical protein